MSVEADLIMASARLARAAPESWKQFLGAVEAYSDQQTQTCIQSPLDELPRAQGRAQATARLFAVFAECLASADRLERNRK